MKYTFTILKIFTHGFTHGTRIIWNENLDDCLIFIVIAIFHLELLFYAPYEETIPAIFLGCSAMMLILNTKVYQTQKKTLMFAIYYILWEIWAIEIQQSPLLW